MNCPKCGKFAKSLLIDNLRDSIKYYLCECRCGERFAYASEWEHEIMMGEAVCNQWLIDKEPLEKRLKDSKLDNKEDSHD